ncbi:MAG TPA: hypothetical protein VLA49_20485 [Anaerolineales bacterium]|nr:hypothetical protein [Anaerolineales bacterium]
MTKDQRSVASFVIRFTQHLWKDEGEEPHLQWRGHIRHVQGDQEASFTDLNDALVFIRDHLTQLTLIAAADEKLTEQERILGESFKLWEGLTSSYVEMMKDALQRTLKQSDAMTGQLDEAVARAQRSWNMPLSADRQKIDTALEQLNAHIQSLTEKVSELEHVLSGGE